MNAGARYGLFLGPIITPLIIFFRENHGLIARAWGESMEAMSVRDMLRFRHFPDWRRSGRSA